MKKFDSSYISTMPFDCAWIITPYSPLILWKTEETILRVTSCSLKEFNCMIEDSSELLDKVPISVTDSSLTVIVSGKSLLLSSKNVSPLKRVDSLRLSRS